MTKLQKGYVGFLLFALACSAAIIWLLLSGTFSNAGWPVTAGFTLLLICFLAFAFQCVLAVTSGYAAAKWDSRPAKMLSWLCVAWMLGLLLWHQLPGHR
ncbi:MAG TPA: hypothetical protein VFE05_01000 [Longimicrobiaceae bacterium]|jgi:hypothetical protein|nr:hypothetical protein [Longimicrobiaceae bacterium]